VEAGDLVTRLLEDILAQPDRLAAICDYTLGKGREAFARAVELIGQAPRIVVVGVGASWNAGVAALEVFDGRACLCDASELMFAPAISFPRRTAFIFLSRSGRSMEILRCMDRVRGKDHGIVAVTNAPDSPLARHADATLLLNVPFDYAVSVTMYSGIALVAAMLGGTPEQGEGLSKLFAQTASAMAEWRQRIEGSPWLDPTGPAYFLARGGSLASAHEARLLWEEAVKLPATALATGNFRHGPQEIIRSGLRVGMWIHPDRSRDEDLRLAADLRRFGVRVMLIGQNLAASADLVLEIPPTAGPRQFLVDVMPAQLMAERLARLRGVDCDTFRYGAHVVEGEGGLPGGGTGSGPSPLGKP
jgi:glucosamine--fructose-6-phosphate aminotransferase (isomerizing)